VAALDGGRAGVWGMEKRAEEVAAVVAGSWGARRVEVRPWRRRGLSCGRGRSSWERPRGLGEWGEGVVSGAA